MATSPTDPTTKATAPSMDSGNDDLDLGSATTGRRSFLKIGGLGVAVSAFAAACVQQVKVTDKMAQTGTIVAAPTTEVPPFPGTRANDAELTLTALSLEKLLIETYELVLSSNWLTTASFVTVAKAFVEDHEAHIPVLEGMARSLGQDPGAVDANETVKTDEVDVSVEAIKADGSDKTKVQSDALTLLLELEDTIAQLYAKAGGEGTTAEVRSQFTAISASESRHCAVLSGMIGRPPAPFAFQHTAPAALSDEAWVTPNKPVTTTGTAAP